MTLVWILQNPENFPIDMGYATPSHMGKPGEIWGVVRELQVDFGWSDAEIRGFLGQPHEALRGETWTEWSETAPLSEFDARGWSHRVTG